MEQHAPVEQLIAAVRSGALVVTANQRLSRTLRRMYDDAQSRGGNRVWTSARILPMAAWLRAAWSEAALCGAVEPRLLLAPHQVDAVWRRIVEASAEAATLLSMREAAQSAAEAWGLMRAYRLTWNEPLFAVHEDWSAFYQWATLFRRECDAHAWIDEARLSDQVTEAAAARSIAVPARLLLAGFDEFTPQQQFLLDALAAAGCTPERLPPLSRAPETIRVRAADAVAELQHAALWARRLLERGESGIGVVIPTLTGLRDRAERIFTEVLHPEQTHSPEARPPSAFHISAGPPLVGYPIVSAALDILQLGAPVLPLDEIGRLLRSPFLAGAGVEASSRALLDARLRRMRRAEVALETVRRLAEQKDATLHSPVFASIAGRCEQLRAALPRAAPPSAWTGALEDLLEAAGWPGDDVLSSAEYQTVARWKELLKRFASLDLAARDWSFDQAVARLGELAEDERFQPEDEDAPVQIMGALEAAGATFNHLWVTGLDDRHWPSPARPHPFLPLSLQREHKLPHSSPDREMEFSRQTLARFQGSAPRIVFSWPEREGDLELRPSALIPAAPLHHPNRPAGRPERPLLEALAENPAPPFTTERASGGVAILKRQAECPFRAFAELRLGAKELDSGELGISAADRGSVAHRALQLLWSRLESHDRLVALSAEELERIAADCARLALRRDGARQSAFQRRFLEMEQDRLRRLLLEWLELERPRRPFTVAAQEDKHTVEIGGIVVEGRIDRVDVLDDGREIIIDYKANAPSAAAWDGDRPNEPQVPFYAVYPRRNIAAVAFGQLTPGDLRFKGYAAEAGLLTDVKAFTATRDGALYDSLEQLLSEWRPRLERLAQEFREGRAAVDPKQGAKTCATCHLDSLCRIRDLSAPAAGEPDDGA